LIIYNIILLFLLDLSYKWTVIFNDWSFWISTKIVCKPSYWQHWFKKNIKSSVFLKINNFFIPSFLLSLNSYKMIKFNHFILKFRFPNSLKIMLNSFFHNSSTDVINIMYFYKIKLVSCLTSYLWVPLFGLELRQIKRSAPL